MEISDEILGISNEDPEEAIRIVLELPNNRETDVLKSAILIDCGNDLLDKNSVEKGVNIAKRLQEEYPDNVQLKYNLANGLHALAKLTPFEDPSWYISTHLYRSNARQLFSGVSKSDEIKDISTQASTNLGNLLNSSYRWVEAFDSYNDALANDPSNGVASSGAAKILKHCLDTGIGNPDTIKHSINKYNAITESSMSRIFQYAGSIGMEGIRSEITSYDIEPEKSDTVELSDYERFVLKNRLALSPTIENTEMGIKRWDDLRIYSIREDVGSDQGVPPIFSMFNIMKSDYILARWLAYEPMNSDIPDTGYYSDTLDYGNYGAKYSLLTLAQRSAIDILDKIAVSTLEYLKMGGAKNAHFKNAWYNESDKGFRWKSKIKDSIFEGNTALIALTEISRDFSEKNGFLKSISSLRNASTHRFVVLHDFGGNSRARQSKSVEHYPIEEFADSLIDTLKVVRSSLMYYFEFVAISESIKNQNNSGFVGQLDVPSHHYIRGEDE